MGLSKHELILSPLANDKGNCVFGTEGLAAQRNTILMSRDSSSFAGVWAVINTWKPEMVYSGGQSNPTDLTRDISDPEFWWQHVLVHAKFMSNLCKTLLCSFELQRFAIPALCISVCNVEIVCARQWKRSMFPDIIWCIGYHPGCWKDQMPCGV